MNRGAILEERTVVAGRAARYLTAGEGPPLVLLHALGENALDWSWVLPALARGRRVYAPDLPGITGDGGGVADFSPGSFALFLAGFLDALGIERAAIAGNSLGGLVALRLALSDPARVSALCLVDSAGLGRTVTYALRAPTLPGYGEVAIAWTKTAPGPERGRPAEGGEPGRFTRLRTPAPGRASGPLRGRSRTVPRREGKPLAGRPARPGAQVLRV